MKIRFSKDGTWGDRTQPGLVHEVKAGQVINISKALAEIVIRQGAGAVASEPVVDEEPRMAKPPEAPDAGPQQKAEGEGKQAKAEGKRKRSRKGK
jgi:hypothetical protein